MIYEALPLPEPSRGPSATRRPSKGPLGRGPRCRAAGGGPDGRGLLPSGLGLVGTGRKFLTARVSGRGPRGGGILPAGFPPLGGGRERGKGGPAPRGIPRGIGCRTPLGRGGRPWGKGGRPRGLIGILSVMLRA